MSTLRDGRFIFIHADRRTLLVEQPASAASATPSGPAPSSASAHPPVPLVAQIVYGGAVQAFALNAAQSHIALVCPAGSATATTSAAVGHLRGGSLDSPRSVLRLFTFTRGGEVGELVDELVTAAACGVTWVGARHLALDVRQEGSSVKDGTSAAVVLMELTKAPEKLRWVRQDEGAAAPAAGPGGALCDVDRTKQSLRFWDVTKGKVTQAFPLPSRRCRHRRNRTAAATCSDGAFVLVANDDWTVHCFHMSRRAVRELKPLMTQFESQSLNMANQRGGEAPAEAGEDGAGGATANPPSPSAPLHAATSHASTAAPTPLRLFCQAVSTTQVVIALQGSPMLLQCACDSKPTGGAGGSDGDDEWSVVAKMRLPRRMAASCEVVGLSARGCLVRQFEAPATDDGLARGSGGSSPAAARASKTVAYYVLPLEMKATGKAALQAVAAPAVDAATPGEASGDGAAAAAPVESASVDGGVAATEATEDAQTESKRKRKKKKAAAAAAAAAATPEVAAASTPGSGSPPPAGAARDAGKGQASSPLQRAVGRLLVHAGVGSKASFPDAFSREDAAVAGADVVVEASSAPPSATEEDARPAAGGAPWYSSDLAISAGGVVVGVVLGVLMMRRLSLL